jgi:hypothetical protein
MKYQLVPTMYRVPIGTPEIEVPISTQPFRGVLIGTTGRTAPVGIAAPEAQARRRQWL